MINIKYALRNIPSKCVNSLRLQCVVQTIIIYDPTGRITPFDLLAPIPITALTNIHICTDIHMYIFRKKNHYLHIYLYRYIGSTRLWDIQIHVYTTLFSFLAYILCIHSLVYFFTFKVAFLKILIYLTKYIHTHKFKTSLNILVSSCYTMICYFLIHSSNTFQVSFLKI